MSAYVIEMTLIGNARCEPTDAETGKIARSLAVRLESRRISLWLFNAKASELIRSLSESAQSWLRRISEYPS
jgi:hypothetical protein